MIKDSPNPPTTLFTIRPELGMETPAGQCVPGPGLYQ